MPPFLDNAKMRCFEKNFCFFCKGEDVADFWRIKMISIIIPCFNEKDSIRVIVEKVHKIMKSMNKKYEIVIVDDGSYDGTREILNRLNGCRVFYHQQNRGKGACIHTALSYVKGDIIIIQDADFEYNPDDYPKLLRPIFENKADVVYGSRFLRQNNFKYKINYIANKFMTFLLNKLNNVSFSDIHTGYKIFKKDVISDIDMERYDFAFDPELTVKMAKKINKGKIKFTEVAISYCPRTYKEGKKIKWKDGIKAIWVILYYSLFWELDYNQVPILDIC
jgi:glycosyltransferase involved in cell wall biosynthesis